MRVVQGLMVLMVGLRRNRSSATRWPPAYKQMCMLLLPLGLVSLVLCFEEKAQLSHALSRCPLLSQRNAHLNPIVAADPLPCMQGIVQAVCTGAWAGRHPGLAGGADHPADAGQPAQPPVRQR